MTKPQKVARVCRELERFLYRYARRTNRIVKVSGGTGVRLEWAYKLPFDDVGLLRIRVYPYQIVRVDDFNIEIVEKEC